MYLSSPHSCSSYYRLQNCWAIGWLLLLAVSWRLWIPSDLFPSIPLIGIPSLPPALDVVLLAGWVALLLAVIAFGKRHREAIFIALALLGVCLVLLNQHRLQPWFYQAILLSILFAGLKPERGLAAVRWLTIGIYLFSSLGKLDSQFLHTVGQQFLQTIVQPTGIDISSWPSSSRLWLAGLFPAGEFVIVLGLMIRPTRKLAAWLAIGMHTTMILVLSPLGLGHQPGVLLWNVMMIVQLIVLFGLFDRSPADAAPASTEPAAEPVAQPSKRFAAPLALAILAAAMLLPLGERFGFWDHWPSWALYSPHSSRVDLQIHGSAANKLPPHIKAHLAPADEMGWQTLALDRWSIDTLGVPIYPQARFQLGVANSVIDRYGLERASRGRLRGVADRWTGERETVSFQNATEREKLSERYWLSSQPR